MKKIGKTGLIGRFKPLHNGGAIMLGHVCNNSDYVQIGIGSANKYNLRNPFTPKESEGMIRAYFSSVNFSNYDIRYIPDFGHIPEYSDGQKWKHELIEQFGSLDTFVTGNDYVAHLLQPDYHIIHPAEIIPEEEWIMLRATMVRVEMAKGGDWQQYVPDPVAKYLEDNKLVQRFQKEFGLQTLAQLTEKYWLPENLAAEKNHTMEG